MFFTTVNVFARDGIFYGGGIHINAPTNTLSNNTFGFNDVANIGGGVNLGSVWFFNPQLSLGSELAYSYFPKDETTWNQKSRGDIKVNYQLMNLSTQGNIYLSNGDIRPYVGVSFGFYYLRNMVNFDSKYVGTTNDASVSYVSNTVHTGFGPEVGFLLKITRQQFAIISMRYTIIPNIKSEYYPEDNVTINPHGKQNHWGLAAKYFFGKK